MTCLTLWLDTADSHNSQAAVARWQLPGGGWLVPISTVGALVSDSGASAASRMLMTVKPANGHHWVAARVAPSLDALAA